MKTKIIFILAVILLCGQLFEAQAAITQVPVLMSAPVVLYDEANNILADGDYVVTIGLTDLTGATLFTEEQTVSIRDGVCHLAVGQGFAVGSNFTSPSGGLDWSLFNRDGDISVEILVEGQVNPQAVAVLGAQPYSYIAQYALDIADDTITSDKIADGSIREADLSADLLSSLSTGSADSSGAAASAETSVDAANVTVSSSISLSNAPGSNLATVLQGLDAAIGAIRDIDLQQSVADISTSIANLGSTYATDTELSSAVTGVNSSISSLNSTINSLDSTYATDSALSAVSDAKVNKSGDSMTGDLNMGGQSITNVNLVDDVDVSILQQDVDNILNPDVSGEVSSGAIPQAIRPFAYGTIKSTSTNSPTRTCSGYNIETACTFPVSSAPASSNYTVLLTPSRSFAGCFGYPGGSCVAAGKTTSTFSVTCTCDYSGNPNDQDVEFVIFYNN